MDIKFTSQEIPKNSSCVFIIDESLKLSDKLSAINKESNQAIDKAIKTGDFTGKNGKFLSIIGLTGTDIDRIILVGSGEGSSTKNQNDIQELGGKIYSSLAHARVKNAHVIIEGTIGGFAPDFVSANLAFGAKLKSYNFDKYFTKQEDDKKPSMQELSFILDDATSAKNTYKELDAIAEGVFLTRDVVSEPSNVLYPESYADICKELKSLGVKVEILNEKDMTKLGMGSLLSVGNGSSKESRMVVMQWNGSPKNNGKPIAFVGKGVTFDTGGISLKPSLNMHDMKYDMGGSGVVVGLMKALAGRKANVNAIGVIGLVENMPDGNASRPGDVVTSMSGQTIEILNTDAEGRLVLADALWYTQDRFKPKFIIDLATLTGAIVVTLGTHRAGIFGNDDELADRIYRAGEDVSEKVWRLPLSKEYDKQIDSEIADVQNISNTKGGGSITAAQFLQRFVNDTPWVHIDIAGVCWADKAKSITPKGASGYGVRLLNKLVADNYED